jgi:hypothetical protein
MRSRIQKRDKWNNRRLEQNPTWVSQPNSLTGLNTLLCSMSWVELMNLFDIQTQPTVETLTPYLKKKRLWNILLIWWFYDQKIKKLFKKIEKIQTLYLIRLVSGSLGELMGWAFMGWTNQVWKLNPTELTLMDWAGTFVQNPTPRPP